MSQRYKLLETLTYTLPAHWASALINGDYSGLEDQDDDELHKWLDRVNVDELPAGQHIECVDVSEESEFCHSNDAGTLAGDCATFTFLLYEEERERERGE